MNRMKWLSVTALFYISFNTNAALMSYQIDMTGNVIGQSPFRYYEGNRNSGDFWTLNDTTNTIGLGTGQSLPLRTSQFTVSNITDITNTNGAFGWVTVAGSNLSYRVDPVGNVTGTSPLRYFDGNRNSGDMWTLDGLSNTISLNSFSGPSVLRTSLFRVSDITDITFTQGNNAWMTVAGSNLSYRIDAYGNIIGSTELRYYEGNRYSGDYWTLNNAANTIGLGYGQSFALNTNMFRVSDIKDVTYTNGNFAWVLVNQGASPVPLPASAWLFMSGLASLVGFIKRRKNQRH